MFALDEDERAISETAADFAAEFLAPNAVEWDRTKHFPVDVLRKAAALGMGGIYVAEDVGGSGLRRVDAVRIFEKLAAGDPSIAAYLSIHNMVAWMIDTYGSDDQRRQWLPALCSMETLGSYCLTEPGAGSDAAALSTKAVRDGDSYVLNGVKQFISGAGESAVYVVMARTGGPGPSGISAFVVDKDTQGLSFGANEAKMGWNAQPTRQVILEDVTVPAENLLGGEGNGFRIAMNGLNGGRINIAACSLGGATAAFDAAVSYLADRRAFGSRLLDAQALQFRLADMRTDLEAARVLLLRAASALDADAPDKVQLCAMAKKFTTDVGFTVANDALQLLGGYGYLSEYGLEKIVRDLRVHQILEGTNEVMRIVIARSVVGAA
ncbi:acyl-CoA dehydrogenase family protein [Rhodococcus sp. BP-349]|uniref:acyl-CoA dehydrogenase family protein n=1 Tax=unclassified Rhodococcus (in: high G+C Gram-positive bacteria) TaxID=192944 RepID=UPI001C9BB531|nr:MULTISPECIES: acyl-CoA dehydrogenase family protein [unclassified Rhodococcus (in: high G+C Gram-positive bacteria)]MBY6540217.1 acyl-CoA dehydrogenase family protein [Rhodococcus sp. BP-363]MBY6543455.1 acyl-CoA dehydrogenase family protein [Rhodococcus sp. BP-369]MBY6562685.1 acyl-CoA dehydrogenase family protein [Rhodococcus sp. BP-370]MBY6576977.1 acyl-CoA dehydrogenase family protein [Rhodococcus sp. BP-364]MBY6586278.1 acyl-CoA dehydrogenase family protein [Rhodococcus sp. BP-358]